VCPSNLWRTIVNDNDLMPSASSTSTAVAQRPPASRAPVYRNLVDDSDLPAQGSSRSPVIIGGSSGGGRFKDGSEGEPAASTTGGESLEATGGGAALFAEVSQEGQGESGADEAEASATEVNRVGAAVGAFGDLAMLDGYRRRSAASGTESDAEGAGDVPEAGQALGGTEANAEFLPFLAAALPKIISIGAPLVQSIFSKVGPAVQNAVNRTPPRPFAPLTGNARPQPPVGMNAVLQRIMQMLSSMKFESGQEGTLSEADEQLASEVAAAMEVLIGNDDRIRITNTTATPWRSIAALRITFPSGAVYRGTGFFISARVLATAGHCVYLRNQGGWARSVEVIPAMNGSTRPYGTARSSNLRSVSGWTVHARPEADIGCIVLPAGSLNGNPGSFGFAAFTAADLKAQPAVLAGYPGDKPFAELWGMARVVKTVTDKTLIYDIDTMGGQSGAPVYVKRNGKRYVVGIHNYGAQSGNSATRVTQPVFEVLSRWSTL